MWSNTATYTSTRTAAYDIEPWPPARSASDPSWMLGQPSRLLDARSQVVDFVGRDQELLDLAEWRDDSRAGLAVCLLHGPGGQGKTRLATEFARLSNDAGWTVLQARYTGGLGVAAVARWARSRELALLEPVF